MCKKSFVIFLALMISLSLCGCTFSDRDMDIYEKIHKTYNNMESYSADLDMTVFSNKTENRYFVSQKAKLPDKFYTRITDPDGIFSVTTITNGAVTQVKADGSDYSITVPNDDYMNLLFVNNFLKAYYASESTSLTVDSSITNSDRTVLSTDIHESDICIKSASVSFDNKTLKPVSVTLYGENREILARATYENFTLNDKTDDSVFCTE